MVKTTKLSQTASLESLCHFKADYTRMLLSKTKCFKRTFQIGKCLFVKRWGPTNFLASSFKYPSH